MAGLLALLAGPVVAQCRLALILALDTSSSVDPGERTLQLEGLARAFEDPEVREAIFAIPGTSISFLVFEWSGQYDHDVVGGWWSVRGPADLAALIERIRAVGGRKLNRPTALGAALEFSRQKFAEVPQCLERKIDVSGDGRNNDGIPPERLYQWRDFSGITVNALAIGSESRALPDYFRDRVVRGPGAFVMEARNYADYARAMREKLIREIGLARLGALPRP
mgnify:CR=1 FL=1